MAKKIVDGETPEGKNYSIQPAHINAMSHFWDAFGNMETEVSARLIVRLCQKAGAWAPFTEAEINVFTKQDFHFNRLASCGDENRDNDFVILGADGRYRVTHEFIASCFKSSPAV